MASSDLREGLKRRLAVVREDGIMGHLAQELEAQGSWRTELRRQPTVFFLPELAYQWVGGPFWMDEDERPRGEAVDGTSVRELSSAITATRRTLEGAMESIRDEFRSLSASSGASSLVTLSKHATGECREFDLLKEGQWQEKLALHCPHTCELLKGLPICKAGFGNVYFFTLAPGAQIRPRQGLTNLTLRLLFAIDDAPPGEEDLESSGQADDVPVFRAVVAGVEKELSPGMSLVFDDSVTHSASNPSERRTLSVLCVDLWHPSIAASPDMKRQIIEAFPPGRSPRAGLITQSTIISRLLHPRMLQCVQTYLPLPSVGAAACVCQRWKVASTNELWREIFFHSFPSMFAMLSISGGEFLNEIDWKERSKHELEESKNGLRFDYSPTMVDELPEGENEKPPRDFHVLMKVRR